VCLIGHSTRRQYKIKPDIYPTIILRVNERESNIHNSFYSDRRLDLFSIIRFSLTIKSFRIIPNPYFVPTKQLPNPFLLTKYPIYVQ